LFESVYVSWAVFHCLIGRCLAAALRVCRRSRSPIAIAGLGRVLTPLVERFFHSVKQTDSGGTINGVCLYAAFGEVSI
jgi:hypothetical protein